MIEYDEPVDAAEVLGVAGDDRLDVLAQRLERVPLARSVAGPGCEVRSRIRSMM